MALLHLEGFGGAGTTAARMKEYLGRRYELGASTTYIYNYPGALSGQCLRIGYNNNSVSMIIPDTQTIVVGFHYKVDTGLSASLRVVSLLTSGGTSQLRLGKTTDGNLQLRRGGSADTILGTTVGLGLNTVDWVYIELKAHIHDSEGFFELRVNNKVVLSDSGINTAYDPGNLSVGRLNIGTQSYPLVYYARYDNIYILDTTGTRNNNFLGPIDISIFRPASDYSVEWSRNGGDNNFSRISETYSDGDTTYVEATDEDALDLYGYGSLSNEEDILGITIQTECRDTDGDGYTIIASILSDATSDDSAPQLTTATYFIYSYLSETNPKDSKQWDISTLNNAKIGVKVGV
ncbi:MAG: hypothetical protein WC942_02460 [Clostridia bacterium]|jgi:hypothetical protein